MGFKSRSGSQVTSQIDFLPTREVCFSRPCRPDAEAGQAPVSVIAVATSEPCISHAVSHLEWNISLSLENLGCVSFPFSSVSCWGHGPPSVLSVSHIFCLVCDVRLPFLLSLKNYLNICIFPRGHSILLLCLRRVCKYSLKFGSVMLVCCFQMLSPV